MARYLVVGGGSGIGEALTKNLLSKDHDVSILCRTDPLIPEATYHSCDVTKDTDRMPFIGPLKVRLFGV